MRLEKLKKLSEELNSCIVISGESNLFYFLGYDGVGSLIYCDGIPTLIVPALEENRASLIKGIDTEIYFPIKISDNFIQSSLVSIILDKIRNASKVSLDANWSSIPFYKAIESKFPVQDISENILKIRAVKDEDELEFIKRSGDITAEAMKVVSEKLSEGVEFSEKFLSGIIDYTMKISGAEDYAFPSIVAAGPNSSKPHHVPTDYKVTRGDPVVVDIGAKYNGYCFDSTRTFLTEKRDEVRKIYEVVLEAQLEAIDAVVAGIQASEIDKIARKVIEKAGYGRYFVHSTGHGVGIEVHEYPPVSFNSNAILEKNMVITVEPGIYIGGKHGVRIEDTMIVTEGKPIVIETIYKLL
ncbi:aminopeptidase P family protein [Acidianus sp. RZ1]|uniref:aminopeptidase P family protein n=1 Tax=Acidianus sp. RZ1 TaxID=1540082 RepID=UPI0014926578|nr:aminopeptidase P family protein [Acidianus sp. RZ1]NON61386.1 aminopeptidase P family protein [Acidianus sp. RZ1]